MSSDVATSAARKRFSIGLTGGIGSGKTTVADMFAARGATLVDTDLIAHQITAPGGAAIDAIRAEFGEQAIKPDGAMDRARMREMVFADPGAKLRLEAILHPVIRAETELQAQQASGTYVIFVVPLLVESGGWKQRVSRVLVVDCPELTQIARVQMRSALDEEQVRAIMATQVSRAMRLAAADDVLVNDSDAAELGPQVDRLHALYCSLAQSQA